MSFDVKFDDGLQKIREAGAATIRQLDKLRSTELMTRATFDAEVAHIAQENLPPYGCHFVVHRMSGVLSTVLPSKSLLTLREY